MKGPPGSDLQLDQFSGNSVPSALSCLNPEHRLPALAEQGGLGY